MYKGIKKAKLNNCNTKNINGNIMVLQEEQIEKNGIITRQLKFKTKKYERDKTKTWKDFEIGNLIAAGIDPNSLPKTILEADVNQLHQEAAKAESVLNEYEIIKELSDEQTEVQ